MKKEYIEIEVIDWSAVFISLFIYPLIILIGLALFIFNFIRYGIKLLIYLIVCFIPILNSGILYSVDEPNFFESFDEFKIDKIFHNLKMIKRFEVKKEKSKGRR